MGRLALLLLALCLVTGSCQNSEGKDEDLLDGYREVREELREIFARGVDPESQRQKDASTSSSLERRRLVISQEELQEGVSLARRAHSHGHPGDEPAPLYLNEWVVHLTGGPHLAATVAKDLGYHFLGQVGGLQDVYRLLKKNHPPKRKRAAHDLTRHLNAHTKVVWAEQQFSKERTKRYAPARPFEEVEAAWEEQERSGRSKRDGRKYWKWNKIKESRMEAALRMERMFNDEIWSHQWYLFDTRTRGDLPKLDLQVVGAWHQGYTGKGVRVQVLDDGLEWTHEDLRGNYDPEISTDLNGNSSTPQPRYDTMLSNSHGTRCAGEIAMIPNNRKCGVGVAYGAKIGGVRMLDGPVSDVVEGLSLEYGLGKVDVVSCSWGPIDDGMRVEGPGRIAEMALKRGIEEGRDGKGTIYVWAAGNGGSAFDNCNCDGYTSSVNTLTISSATESGSFPWYGELCTSTLAAAYSSGAYTDQKIATVDLNNTCTIRFSGTSAAAPLAAGIVALTLEANPNMTWRDVQHAVVWTSEWWPLANNYGWRTNKRGLKINPRFGFGLLNAEGMVRLARDWKNVPEQKICTVKATTKSSRSLRSGEWVEAKFDGKECEEVRVLEHVQVVASIQYSRRGALTLTLTSPQGTPVDLLTERFLDESKKGFIRWPFTSVLTWGENPRGTWTLNVSDSTQGSHSGFVGELELVLYGTTETPEHMKTQKKRDSPTERQEEEEEEEEEEDLQEEEEEEEGAANLRTLSWEQLLTLLTKSTRSSPSRAALESLLKEGRREDALKSLRAQGKKLQTHQGQQEYEVNRRIVNELMKRR
ncbi:neuroendocrine convertase 1-like isoform X2 [Portunus trituberculatus]|uniref:neuroendocrine convertase 1-like isoform X2 n=1 Tax=Portunus trituberculatus TaxID=210409 RepID=UPI001E1CEB56|nr:neuroendocrine convertase 1-like isoform X2 [Portunus trituberculatus]